jgi:tetrahydromethanopterin S-methyltransferase subunit G
MMIGQTITLDSGTMHWLVVGMLVCAGSVVLTIVAQVVNLVRGGKAQKREVSFSESFVTRESCELQNRHLNDRMKVLEAQIKEIREGMDRDRHELGKLVREECGKLHDRVDDVLSAVSGQQGEMRQVTQRLQDLMVNRKAD